MENLTKYNKQLKANKTNMKQRVYSAVLKLYADDYVVKRKDEQNKEIIQT